MMDDTKIQWDFDYEAAYHELDEEQQYSFHKDGTLLPENMMDTIEEYLKEFPHQRDPDREGYYDEVLQLANQISCENRALLHVRIHPKWGYLGIGIKAPHIEVRDAHLYSRLMELADSVCFESCDSDGTVQMLATVDCFMPDSEEESLEDIIDFLKKGFSAAFRKNGLLDAQGSYTEAGCRFVDKVRAVITEDGHPFRLCFLLGEELGYLKDGELTEKGRQHKNWLKEISEFSVPDISTDQFRDGEKE